ncbi:DUF31 family protein [Mesomycoplasma molare]|uniref:DUF31 family protein n=2 Tax=Mesomycoplasma molare TaxID=171288 RepID=A0ABY5TXW7_9BACT|nr:DUF31 family protein [Mesomycoplasma molare]UWD33879.1 DUF31 family protein [Mesomycoplasma molare]
MVTLFGFISCANLETRETENSNNQNTFNSVTEENIGEIVNSLEVDFQNFSETNKPKDDTFFSEFSKNQNSISVNLSGKNNDLLNAKLLAVIPDRDKNGIDISNTTGNGKVLIEFSSKINKNIKIEKTINITGFKKIAINIDENGYIKNNPADFIDLEDKEKYVLRYNQKERYDWDNKNYLNILKRQLENNSQANATNFRNDASINENSKQKFDEKATEAGIDTYDSASLKGFTIPTYNENGEYKGLNIFDHAEILKGPSWVDSEGREFNRTKGIARYLTNDFYKKIGLQTFQATFNRQDDENPNSYKPESGTLWILDFQKTEDGSYPTKWYFGTNLHVAEAITNKTFSFSLARLNENAPVRTVLKINNFEENITRFGFPIYLENQEFQPLKVIYSGEDFLNSTPSQFLNENQKEKFKDVEEFADFAVIEIDFSKIRRDDDQRGITISAGNKNDSHAYGDVDPNKALSSPQELAKAVTNNYASKTEDHIKFMSTSYLKDYSRIDRNLNYKEVHNKDQLYILGYPSAREDYFLKEYEDDYQKEHSKNTFSLWTNAETKYFDNIKRDEVTNKYNFSEEEINRGNFLSYEIGYRSFVEKPGVLDAFISATRVGKELHISKLNGNKKLIFSGLSYMPKHYVPIGGSSGSSIRNQNNELVAVFHAGNQSAKTGLAAAFRSEGYDYKGIYGTGDNKYSLPQYDLIYGGGKDQKNSYREALIKAYGTSYKTNLFGDNINEIPEKFKFKENDVVIDARTTSK